MSRAERQYLFVYGTLRQDGDHPMSRVLRRHARRVGRGRFRGRLYPIGWYPGARDSSLEEDRVHGELYALVRPGPCLAMLDDYEGDAFERRQRPIEAGRRRYRAWIYLYTGPTRGLSRIPDGRFRPRRSAQTR